uniref:Uncharacterized protein n=2 Tax=Peronospora matthiolae TaxID=2874970 RepID=A0AAV1UI53_9STRA
MSGSALSRTELLYHMSMLLLSLFSNCPHLLTLCSKIRFCLDMNNHGWSTDALCATVSGFGFRGRCFTLVLALVLFCIALTFPVLCCLRQDGSISVSWMLVFTPLWILDAVYYGYALFSLIFSDVKLFSFCKLLLLLLTQALIVIKLNGVVDWSLLAVLTPYFMYEGLNVLETLAGTVQRYQIPLTDNIEAGALQTESTDTEGWLLAKAVVHKTGFILLPILEASLTEMKVDGRLLGTSWWQIMTPVWILVAYRFCCLVAHYRNSTSTDELTDAVITGGVNFLLAAPFVLLAERLDGKTVSSFVIVMPWMILMAASFLFLFCAMSLAGSERLVQSGVQPTICLAQSNNSYGTIATS